MKTILAILTSESFKSVGLVVLGWVLGQAKDWFTERREHRKAVSRVLADLLEIRHQFRGIHFVLQELKSLGFCKN